MSLDIKFIPLTFLNSKEEILKQIKNSVLFSFLLSHYEETTLDYYLDSTQYGYTASALEKGDHKLVRITDINNGCVDWEQVPFCNCDSEEKYLLKENDILVARTGGTTGKSFLVSNPPNNAVFASYLIRLRIKKDVEIEFINCFLNSYVFWSQIIEMKSGSAMPNVNAEKLKTLRLPKCDRKVQKEIITIFQEEENHPFYKDLFKKIYSVENLFKDNNSLSTELTHQLSVVKKIRQQLLKDAIQGKLVEQNPNDEPASALLGKVKAEKEQLVKEKKLKHENELPLINIGVIPFEIPENWLWCRLGEIGILKRGKSKHRPRDDKRLFENGKYPFIQTGNVSKAKFNQDLITTVNNYYSEFGLKQSEMQKKGTLCITIAANIAECGFLNFDACVPDSIVCFSSIDQAIEKYAYYYLKIAKEELERFAPATAQKNINLGILNDFPIPIPPLSEQHRIVQKLEQLMQTCNALEESIKLSALQNEKLLQQVLREALQPQKMITLD